jgi:hypothetical protein
MIVRDQTGTVSKGAPNGWMLERRQQTCQEGRNGIRDQDLKEHLRLRSQRAFSKVLGQIIGLEAAKQAVEFSIRLWKMNVRTFWRGWSLPKRKKRLHTE